MAALVYVGCGSVNGDVVIFSLDQATGALTKTGLAEAGGSTSFSALHPSGKYLYLTRNRSHHVAAFAVDATTGALTMLNLVAAVGADPSLGANPAYLTVDRTGKFLLAANYSGHSVNVFPILPDGGLADLVCTLSAGKNAHSVRLDPGNQFAFVPYLGSDLVAQYRFDEMSGQLTPNRPAAVAVGAGEGPRHFDFHPNGRWVYLLTETGCSIYAFNFDAAQGSWAQFQQVSTVPAGYTGRKWAGDIHVAPSGRFLYASNRAHESLVGFAIGPTDGRLTLVEHVPSGGKTPRNFTLSPDGRFLFVANQDEHNLVTFAVDTATGKLTKVATLADLCTSPYFVRVVQL